MDTCVQYYCGDTCFRVFSVFNGDVKYIIPSANNCHHNKTKLFEVVDLFSQLVRVHACLHELCGTNSLLLVCWTWWSQRNASRLFSSGRTWMKLFYHLWNYYKWTTTDRFFHMCYEAASLQVVYVAVPDRNRILFRCVFRVHHRVWRAIALKFR